MSAFPVIQPKFLLVAIGIVSLSGLVLSGCSLGINLKNSLYPNGPTPPSGTTDSIMVNPTTTQPTTTAEQDVNEENSGLKALDKEAVKVDQSFNDQAINVN